MKVTRDVVYDLLPTYFAGEASEDTRALLEEFFASDPEFGRMAERFRSLMTERPRVGGEAAETARAKIVFDRARMRFRLRLGAVVWALGAAFGLAMAAIRSISGDLGGFRHPGVVIAAVFAPMAVAMWLMSYSRRPEEWYASFTGGRNP